MPRRSLEPGANQTQAGCTLKRQKRSPPDLALLPCCRAVPSLARHQRPSKSQDPEPSLLPLSSSQGPGPDRYTRSAREQQAFRPRALPYPSPSSSSSCPRNRNRQLRFRPGSGQSGDPPRTEMGRTGGFSFQGLPSWEGQLGSCCDRPLDQQRAAAEDPPPRQSLPCFVLRATKQDCGSYVYSSSL